MEHIKTLTILFVLIGTLDAAPLQVRRSSSVGGVRFVDLSHSYDNDTISLGFPGLLHYSSKITYKGYTPDGYWLAINRFCMSEHTGTHIDAPIHFGFGKWSVDEIPLERFVANAVVVDVRHKVAKDHNYAVTDEDLQEWERRYGMFPDRSVVFFLTGWSKYHNNFTAYYGTKFEIGVNPFEPRNDTFPGLHPSAARMIADYETKTGRQIFGVGLDSPSLDAAKNKHFESHRIILEKNIYGIENIAGTLNEIPICGSQVLVMPMKVKGGTGGPARVIAVVPCS